VNDRPWLAALIYPAPLYVSILAVVQWWGGSVPLLVGFALALGFGLLTAVGVVHHPAVVAGGRVLLSFLAVLPIALVTEFGGASVDLAVGVILGAPFVWLEYAWRADASPGTRVLTLELTFLLGVLTIATGSVGAGTTSGSPGEQFVSALANVLSAQVQGIAALITGGVATSMPLGSALNVWYVGLAAVAVAGSLCPVFLPQTGLGEPLPWSWGATSTPTDSDDALLAERLALRPGQREALASRTLPAAPSGVTAPGFTSVIIGGVLAAAFVVLAVGAPAITLSVLAFGTVAAVLAVAMVLSRRLAAPGEGDADRPGTAEAQLEEPGPGGPAPGGVSGAPTVGSRAETSPLRAAGSASGPVARRTEP
jgi:hypothetical protein